MATTSSLYLIDEFLNRPDAPLLLKQLNAHFQEEKKKRANFYNEIDDSVKAEFINGDIVIHSPVVKAHNVANGNLYKIIDTFVVDNDLGFVGVEKILVKFSRNDYEPDLCFFKKERAALFLDDQKIFPVPDLIIEVLSSSTEKRDRGIKFQDYQNHGVAEYWIVDAKTKVIEQYSLKGNQYELTLKSHSGNITSHVMPNLSIPIAVIFDKKETNQFISNL